MTNNETSAYIQNQWYQLKYKSPNETPFFRQQIHRTPLVDFLFVTICVRLKSNYIPRAGHMTISAQSLRKLRSEKKESTRKVKNVEFWRKLKSLISFEALSIIDKLHCMKSECLHLMHQWWLNAWYNKTGDYLIVFIAVCLARKVLGKRYKNQTQSLFYCPGIDNAEWQSMCNRIEKLKCCQSLREFAILYIMESMPNVNFILKCNKRFGIGVVTVTVKLTQK